MNVVYLNNYMNDEVIKARNNKSIYSQAANNKITGICNSLKSNNVNVKVISTGIVNNRSIKYYSRLESSENMNVIFSGIVDIPLFNIISSVFFTLKEIKQIVKKENIDSIIFYNYKPEVALAAYIAKRLYKIPIVVEYEDGYESVHGLSQFKRKIFKMTENVVSKVVDGAILVNSKIHVGNIPKVVIRGVSNEQLLRKSIILSKKTYTDKIKIAFTSGIDEERGIRVLLESLKYTKKDFQLNITGRGPLEELIRECSDRRVKFLGFLSYEDVNNLLIDSDILVNAQLSNHSFGNVSFPSKIFEYISTGNLVVSSNVSDISEFHKGLFYIYENDDPVKLAMMIDRAIADIENNKVDRNLNFRFAKENLPSEIGKIIKDGLLNKIINKRLENKSTSSNNHEKSLGKVSDYNDRSISSYTNKE